MCQAVAYLDDKEIMHDVVWVEPVLDGVRLTAFLEPPRVVRGNLREVDLLKHRVLLESAAQDGQSDEQRSAINDSERLRALIPHWIEHNTEHADDLRRWAGLVAEVGPDIMAAADALTRSGELLVLALQKLGSGQMDHSCHS